MSCLFSYAEYSLLLTSESCSEKGMIHLGDIEECKKALIELGIKNDKWNKDNVEVDEGYPKGCYQFVKEESSKQVSFNSHANGSKNNDAAQICKNSEYSNVHSD